ncbi:Ribonuclease H-like superfamily [Sesbania bispinosa]|nr:Ribonuclease H-like superfamily [Sesbania bispinosa]
MDWRKPIVEQLAQRLSSKVTKEYLELQGVLYRKGSDGLLMKCVSEKEGLEKAENLHYAICGEGGLSLYRRMQGEEHREVMEVNAIEIDWTHPLKDYLISGELPPERREAEKLKRNAERYICRSQELFKHSHTGGRNIWVEILRLGYQWPSMKEDASDFAKKCAQCQKQGDLIHAPTTSMQGLTSPYPFHMWVMDFINPILPASGGKKWILVATEHYTRWVEAIATKEAKAEVVVSFTKENIVCRFGLPKRIVSDNGTYFVNSKVRKVLEKYAIKHDKSSPYYPQSNVQAESTNKNLICILARMVGDAPREWAAYLPLALWAYKTTKHGSMKATPFSLVYGAEAMLPVEIVVPSARMALGEGMPREASAEIVEEK